MSTSFEAPKPPKPPKRRIYRPARIGKSCRPAAMRVVQLKPQPKPEPPPPGWDSPLPDGSLAFRILHLHPREVQELLDHPLGTEADKAAANKLQHRNWTQSFFRPTRHQISMFYKYIDAAVPTQESVQSFYITGLGNPRYEDYKRQVEDALKRLRELDDQLSPDQLAALAVARASSPVPELADDDSGISDNEDEPPTSAEQGQMAPPYPNGIRIRVVTDAEHGSRMVFEPASASPIHDDSDQEGSQTTTLDDSDEEQVTQLDEDDPHDFQIHVDSDQDEEDRMSIVGDSDQEQRSQTTTLHNSDQEQESQATTLYGSDQEQGGSQVTPIRSDMAFIH
ncbi:hypothetical protein AK830_g4270 [Neonectria ditissima]|uniref:Uncharacterized protein n=1 Tax=Neonectria ditissima TaxID=78410 RepID=A0A0P7BNT2_9HYPO|nr:hypothetical protein AK830_g4270 [Neonectria ditissima]